MSPEQTELARRLVASPRWRWVPGMLAEGKGYDELTHTDTTTPLEWAGQTRVWEDCGSHAIDEGGYRIAAPDAWPVLDDYATAAILLRMAMEATERWEVAHHDGMSAPARESNRQRGFGEWILRGGDHQGEDLGTVAATALLESWGEEGAGRRET